MRVLIYNHNLAQKQIEKPEARTHTHTHKPWITAAAVAPPGRRRRWPGGRGCFGEYFSGWEILRLDPVNSFPAVNKLSWGSVGFALCSSPRANLVLTSLHMVFAIFVFSSLLNIVFRKNNLKEGSCGQIFTRRFFFLFVFCFSIKREKKKWSLLWTTPENKHPENATAEPLEAFGKNTPTAVEPVMSTVQTRLVAAAWKTNPQSQKNKKNITPHE